MHTVTTTELIILAAAAAAAGAMAMALTLTPGALVLGVTCGALASIPATAIATSLALYNRRVMPAEPAIIIARKGAYRQLLTTSSAPARQAGTNRIDARPGEE
jgi:hypothetical protein